jgi:hypothetical protein
LIKLKALVDVDDDGGTDDDVKKISVTKKQIKDSPSTKNRMVPQLKREGFTASC